MKTAVIEAGLAQMVAIGVGAGVGKPMGMALSPLEWPGIVVVVPHLGPPVRRASSKQLTGQTVTETEIISIIYGVYSIHCEDLMEKVVKTG